MDFELFQYAFFFAVIAGLYVIGNTLVGLLIINYHNANITDVIRMNLLFRYERPESIRQDLKEKFGLVSDQEKLTNHYEAMSTGDGK